MNSMIRFAASGIVLGATMVGCKPATSQFRPVSASASEARSGQQASRYYQQAQQVLLKGDLAAAVGAMEQAVALSPRDAGYRMGLAELYTRSGRFVSAETTLTDVLALNPDNTRAELSLALARLAQGKNLSAMTQLQSLEGRAAPADLGLAYALAGNTQRALELLEPAAREQGATGRVRQNLALAYAFAGDWRKARATAAQDVSPSELNKRLADWAVLANPSAVEMRVASMLGVRPVADAGQPARLALAPVAPVVAVQSEPQTSSYVEASPAPAEVAVESTPAVAYADAGTTPPTAPETSAEAIAGEAPEAEAHYAEAAQTLVDSPAVQPAAAESRMASIRTYVASRYDTPTLAPRARKAGRGNFVVQLGAFSTPANVEKAWAQAVRRYAAALPYEPMSTTVRLDGKRVLHRLSMAGFTTQISASRACQSIRAKGGACFVRSIAGDAPVRWASRYTRRG